MVSLLRCLWKVANLKEFPMLRGIKVLIKLGLHDGKRVVLENLYIWFRVYCTSIHNTLIAPSISCTKAVVKECSKSSVKGSGSDQVNTMESGAQLDFIFMLCYSNQSYIYVDPIKVMLVQE